MTVNESLCTTFEQIKEQSLTCTNFLIGCLSHDCVDLKLNIQVLLSHSSVIIIVYYAISQPQ